MVACKLRAWLTVGLFFLCLVIGFQILGAPIAFYDLDGSRNLVESIQLEGFALASDPNDITPGSEWRRHDRAFSRPQTISSDRSLLHPPIFAQ